MNISMIHPHRITCYRMVEVTKMKFLSIISVLGSMLLTATSWGQATIRESCHSEELRRAATDKALASIGCDSFDCAVYKVKPGLDPRNPAASCADVVVLGAESNAPSGYYWLRSSNGSAVRVFCDMILTCKGVGGGWMQVAKLDMTTNCSHQCPLGTKFMIIESKRLCGMNSSQAGCSSTTFAIQGIEYSRVCGKIIAYQYASTDSFKGLNRSGITINDNYVDGISLTYGSPRAHIWTFAAAPDELSTTASYSCPCINNITNNSRSAARPPSFVGNDYFCDTAPAEGWQPRLYTDDPLWDGAGCGPANTCCSLNNPPWFLKQLSSTTTGNIEMRICRDESTHEDVLIEIIELFIQ